MICIFIFFCRSFCFSMLFCCVLSTFYIRIYGYGLLFCECSCRSTYLRQCCKRRRVLAVRTTSDAKCRVWQSYADIHRVSLCPMHLAAAAAAPSMLLMTNLIAHSSYDQYAYVFLLLIIKPVLRARARRTERRTGITRNAAYVFTSLCLSVCL